MCSINRIRKLNNIEQHNERHMVCLRKRDLPQAFVFDKKRIYLLLEDFDFYKPTFSAYKVFFIRSADELDFPFDSAMIRK
jgi:hypothetical protein